MENKISLEKSLLGYRVLHTPTELSLKHWASESFGADEMHGLDSIELRKFERRLTESTITIFDSIKMTTGGHQGHLLDLINIVQNPIYKNVNKINRKVIYTSSTGERPVAKSAFNIWSGFQVIDMDIKDAEVARFFKNEIFHRLKKYNWFLGIALSSSGKGLHIWTKIQIPEGNNDDYTKNKILYLTNFRHKYSFVYLACLKIIEYDNRWSKDDILKWMDMAMFKPQQGAFIPYDDLPLINTNFFEDFIYVNFDNVEDMGHPEIDWVSYPDLKEVFKRWEWFEESDESNIKIDVQDAPMLKADMHNKYHYKHFERWKLANTLVNLYGLEQGFKYMRMICSSDIADKEIKADCVTANRHNKNIEPWAVNRLNKYHGFKIKVNIENGESTNLGELSTEMETIEDPTALGRPQDIHNFYIKKNQYLSHIKKDILKSLARVSLIDAGPGTGKTEFVKELAKNGKKIILVMPFTSTIKSKVDDESIWSVAYGNKPVKFSNNNSICMTVDKFSRLNVLEIKENGFDYIFIDESHLLFQSEYRPIMSNVIERIRTSEVPVVMMSGTPIAESIFFPGLSYIKITKEETRIKEFEVNICTTPDDMILRMCRSMANDIACGKRVLYPTNKGTMYKEEIEAVVKYFLEQDHLWYEPITVNYYKKSNTGEDFMDSINFKKTIDKTDVLLCSTFLSVGVDILDRFDFNIYFNEIWTPQEVEQFANRLRSHDLYIKLFINSQDAAGNDLYINRYVRSDFKLSDNEIKDAHSIVRLCNNMIERNPVEYKYNSLVASIIKNTKYIIYNDIENKYYLNDVAYKTVMFERKYRAYAEQLPVLIKGMSSYGYRYTSKNCDDDLSKYPLIKIEDIRKQTKSNFKAQKNGYIDELLDTLTEDKLRIYRDVANGKYEINKGKGYSEDVIARKIEVRDIEVFEKVVPIVVSMSKMFRIDDIKSIFEFCTNAQGLYNFAAIHRLRTLINIVYNNKKNRLDIPIKDFMNDTYEFLDTHIQKSGDSEAKRSEIMSFIDKFVMEYADKASDDTVLILRSPDTIKRMQDIMYNVFKCLVDIGRPGKGGVCKLAKNEILWKTKEEHEEQLLETISYSIEDFFNLSDVNIEVYE